MVKTNKAMHQRWNNTDRGETEVLTDKSTPNVILTTTNFKRDLLEIESGIPRSEAGE
jgi:hypothetical protein